MENRRVLKAVTSSDLNTGGRLNPQQADRFITYMVDQSAFLQEIRLERMDSPTFDLDTLGVGSRLIRKAVEAQEPTNVVGIQTGKKQLNTVEAILPADISITFLEDNIERAGAEDTIARLLAAQFKNDLIDLMFNGDTGDVGSPDHDFLILDDGLIKLAKASTGTHKFDTNASTDYKGVVFPGMLQMLPDKWKQDKESLRFLVSPSVAEAYVDQLATRNTQLGDELLQTGRLPMFQGVKIRPVPYLPDNVLFLTPIKNIAAGVQRQFTVDRERRPRRRIVEYTMTMRFDAAQIVIDDALVIGYDVTP